MKLDLDDTEYRVKNNMHIIHETKLALIARVRELEAEVNRLQEFATLASECPMGQEHLLRLAAQAILSEVKK